ncbi:Ger(x)C family spore germination protein [Clostridium sp. P21]|uniref:Ger(X)C family spore germination protein n=1 Tax=Clostridium muellerianum TaxID=2716538 RepID=A0A7Y0EE76_9CLOT|nr:Ger(x)C family spore germination protein [Clostridium muellerianum]NMM61733.1 Ger(x)C family spore germination protein [Clostridium muellerianum]
MKIKKYIFYILIICFTLSSTITGCWNNVDLTKRSIAVAIGIDKNDNGKIEVTVQVVNSQQMKGTTEAGLSSKENAVWTLSSTGETTFDSIRNLLKSINRKLFITDVQIIVIGEKLARTGLMETLDFFERDQESNIQAYVLIAKNTTAKNIINAKTKISQIPASHIAETLKNNTALSKTRDIKLFDLMKDLRGKGKNVVIGTIQSENDEGKALVENMKIEGAAAFEKDKLVGWLDAKQIRALLFAEGKVKSTIINFSHPDEEKKEFSIEVLRSKKKESVTFANNKPRFNIKIKLDGNIGEQIDAEDFTVSDKLKVLETQSEKVVERELTDVINYAKKDLKSDIFGFGEILHKKYPEEWKKLSSDWNKKGFSEAEVNIDITTKIRGSGYISKPTKPE